MNVGELIRSIQKPISIYVNEIIQALYEKLQKDLPSVAKCSTPEDCNEKTKPSDLCKSCKSWFDKINDLHENSNNPHWHKNCKSAKWPEDHWEVAKFFMPTLGSKLDTVKDAESTDISFLLNVLERLKDEAFLGKLRVNVDLANKLRSQVRNTWAHAPQQELSNDEMVKTFSIATNFLKDLEKVWSHEKNRECLEHLKHVETSGVTNVDESEFQSLQLARLVLEDIKEEAKIEQTSDRNTIKEHKEELKKLQDASDKCLQNISNMKVKRQQTSCLPDRLQNFTAREKEIQKVITFLVNEEKAVVSLRGGPGFGKTSIANEVSHRLSKDHNIPVVFSELATANNVDEMIRQLCLDVGVNYEDEDPQSSLILWLRNIKSKVIFVMDDIENMLNDRSTFYEFVRLLQKSSNQRCQIVTTSRTSYKIPNITVVDVNVEEMSEEESVELLKKQCPEQEDEFLRKLATLCGKIPLALCIAGSRVQDFKNSDELLKHLQEKPIKILENPESGEYVYRAFNMSYKKCSDDEKETLIRLTVFDGSFSTGAARDVNEMDNLDTIDILKTLVRQSLIKEPLKHRYCFHLLIKHFLVEQQNSEDEMNAERVKAQAIRAELLMVKYFLKLEHKLTMKSLSKDGYKESREALKLEAHNILNVLKICCQKNGPTTSDIPDCLAKSEIYTTSARQFSLFARTIIPSSTIQEFIQRCANIAKERNQHAVKINFDLLLADQGRVKSNSKSDTADFDVRMTKIQEEFKTHEEDIKKDKSLCAHYYYQCGRLLTQKCYQQRGDDRINLQNQAREDLMESWKLRREQHEQSLKSTFSDASMETADTVYLLLQVGHTYKSFADKNEKEAEKYFNEAITLSQDNLGKHELTAHCHKYLGDLFFTNKKFEQAEREYIVVKQMRESLGLETTERYVSVLSNLGRCLIMNKQTNKALEILEIARDLTEKLPESEKAKRGTAKVYASLAIAYDSKGENSDAVKYASKAMTFGKYRHYEDVKRMRKILSMKSNK